MMDFGMLIPPILSGSQQQEAPAAGKPQSIERASQDFESMFISTMMSGLMKTGSLNPADKSTQMQENWVWSLMIQTLAEEWSQNQDLGLAEQVTRHLAEQDG